MPSARSTCYQAGTRFPTTKRDRPASPGHSWDTPLYCQTPSRRHIFFLNWGTKKIRRPENDRCDFSALMKCIHPIGDIKCHEEFFFLMLLSCEGFYEVSMGKYRVSTFWLN